MSTLAGRTHRPWSWLSRLCHDYFKVRFTPMSSLKHWNWSAGRPFLIASATLSDVETFFGLSFPRATHSWMKCYQTSMCFDALLCTGFHAKATAPCLSMRTTRIQLGYDCRNFTSSPLSHKASLAVLDAPIYSTSVVDVAVQSWSFDLHMMDTCLNLKQYPTVDFRLPSRLEGSSGANVM